MLLEVHCASKIAVTCTLEHLLLYELADEDTSDEQSEEEVSQHDEACAICHVADEMDMLLCDGCPKVFHLSCLGLASIPADQWFCAVCNDEA